MTKNNFSENETTIVKNLVTAFGYNVGLTCAGNIKVYKDNANEFFVLYHGTPLPDGNYKYLWRRQVKPTAYSYPSCYPLNMRRVKVKHTYVGSDGKEYEWYSDWNGTQDCELETIFDAVNYFEKYLNKTCRI